MSYVIRHAEPRDYDAIIGKIDSWWGGRSMAPMLPRLFFDHFAPWTFVTECDGHIVGFLAAFRSQTDQATIYCHFIGVDPDHRGKGIGEALYHRLFADARAAGCRSVLAVTSPQNHGSIAFHTRLGFAVVGANRGANDDAVVENYDGPREDRVRFRLLLSAR